jgi:hypothetical protein
MGILHCRSVAVMYRRRNEPGRSGRGAAAPGLQSADDMGILMHMSLSARFQVLMDPKELEELRKIAKQRRTSVGRLFRDAVREKFLGGSEERRRRSAERILAMEIGPLPDWEALEEELGARYDEVP